MRKVGGKQNLGRFAVLLIQGVIVGFGAIMPGISGGALCVAFGMYRPLIEVFSHPRTNLKTHWKRLGVFLLGIGVGFVGLSGLAGWLMSKNSAAFACAFIGLIAGTLPDLWKNAGKKGRGRASYVVMLAGFFIMLGALLFLKDHNAVNLRPGLWSYLLSGVLWGLGFVVPGLGSSTLLLFFGLYQQILDGIAGLSPSVLFPLGAGVLLCLLIFPKGVNAAYRKHYTAMSHAVLGVVVATTVMIIPDFNTSAANIGIYIGCIAVGAAVSYAAGRVFSGQERQEPRKSQDFSA